MSLDGHAMPNDQNNSEDLQNQPSSTNLSHNSFLDDRTFSTGQFSDFADPWNDFQQFISPLIKKKRPSKNSRFIEPQSTSDPMPERLCYIFPNEAHGPTVVLPPSLQDGDCTPRMMVGFMQSGLTLDDITDVMNYDEVPEPGIINRPSDKHENTYSKSKTRKLQTFQNTLSVRGQGWRWKNGTLAEELGTELAKGPINALKRHSNAQHFFRVIGDLHIEDFDRGIFTMSPPFDYKQQTDGDPNIRYQLPTPKEIHPILREILLTQGRSFPTLVEFLQRYPVISDHFYPHGDIPGEEARPTFKRKTRAAAKAKKANTKTSSIQLPPDNQTNPSMGSHQSPSEQSLQYTLWSDFGVFEESIGLTPPSQDLTGNTQLSPTESYLPGNQGQVTPTLFVKDLVDHPYRDVILEFVNEGYHNQDINDIRNVVELSVGDRYLPKLLLTPPHVDITQFDPLNDPNQFDFDLSANDDLPTDSLIRKPHFDGQSNMGHTSYPSHSPYNFPANENRANGHSTSFLYREQPRNTIPSQLVYEPNLPIYQQRNLLSVRGIPHSHDYNNFPRQLSSNRSIQQNRRGQSSVLPNEQQMRMQNNSDIPHSHEHGNFHDQPSPNRLVPHSHAPGNLYQQPSSTHPGESRRSQSSAFPNVQQMRIRNNNDIPHLHKQANYHHLLSLAHPAVQNHTQFSSMLPHKEQMRIQNNRGIPHPHEHSNCYTQTSPARPLQIHAQFSSMFPNTQQEQQQQPRLQTPFPPEIDGAPLESSSINSFNDEPPNYNPFTVNPSWPNLPPLHQGGKGGQDLEFDFELDEPLFLPIQFSVEELEGPGSSDNFFGLD